MINNAVAAAACEEIAEWSEPEGSSSLASMRTWWPVGSCVPITSSLRMMYSLSSDSHLPCPSCDTKNTCHYLTTVCTHHRESAGVVYLVGVVDFVESEEVAAQKVVPQDALVPQFDEETSFQVHRFTATVSRVRQENREPHSQYMYH